MGYTYSYTDSMNRYKSVTTKRDCVTFDVTTNVTTANTATATCNQCNPLFRKCKPVLGIRRIALPVRYLKGIGNKHRYSNAKQVRHIDYESEAQNK